jgi:hypothetical protein
MNPIYKIVKGILDLFRQAKKIKVSPKTKITLEKYGKRIDWKNLNILPIFIGMLGIFFIVYIGTTILKTVIDTAQYQTNTTQIGAPISFRNIPSGIFYVIVLVPIIYIVYKVILD